MILIIAAQHVVVPLLPVFESMTGRAQADQRFAGVHIFFDLAQLVLRKAHSTNKQNDQVRPVQGVDTIKTESGLQVALECRQCPA